MFFLFKKEVYLNRKLFKPEMLSDIQMYIMLSFNFFIMKTVSYRLIATFFSVSSVWSSCPTAAGFCQTSSDDQVLFANSYTNSQLKITLSLNFLPTALICRSI